jgi:hypothetical protein
MSSPAGRENMSAERLYSAMRLPAAERRLGASTWVAQWERSPGFGPAAAALLIEQFPKLRAPAVDFTSMSSPVHRVFLGCTNDGARSILLVEDALLPDSLPPLLRVSSARCAMFAEAAGA